MPVSFFGFLKVGCDSPVVLKAVHASWSMLQDHWRHHTCFWPILQAVVTVIFHRCFLLDHSGAGQAVQEALTKVPILSADFSISINVSSILLCIYNITLLLQ